MNNWDEIRGSSPDICPFVDVGYKECYPSNLTSRNIELALKFCLKDYAKCSHYQTISRRGEII